jgi:hypothetical protein
MDDELFKDDLEAETRAIEASEAAAAAAAAGAAAAAVGDASSFTSFIAAMAAAEEDAKMATEATTFPTAAATVSTSEAATGAAAAGGGTSAGAPAMASPLASLQLCLHELLHAILSFLLRLNVGGGSARLRSTGHGLEHALLPLAAEPFFGYLHKTVQAIFAILLPADAALCFADFAQLRGLHKFLRLLTQSEGCCSICVSACHAGHVVSYSHRSRFFCDCGAGAAAARGITCIALTPRAMPPQPAGSRARATAASARLPIRGASAGRAQHGAPQSGSAAEAAGGATATIAKATAGRTTTSVAAATAGEQRTLQPFSLSGSDRRALLHKLFRSLFSTYVWLLRSLQGALPEDVVPSELDLLSSSKPLVVSNGQHQRAIRCARVPLTSSSAPMVHTHASCVRSSRRVG